MAFKTVNDLDCNTTVSLGGFNKKEKRDNPTETEGYFLGTKVTPNKKTGGTSNLHVLKTPKGNIGIWGKTDMDRKLLQVKPGTMIRISYTGLQATAKGEMYKYTIAQDEDNTVEVEFTPKNTPVSADPDSSYDDEGLDEEESAQEEPVRATVGQLTAAERQAKVQEMFNKNKRKA